jgi:hypothetical protein
MRASGFHTILIGIKDFSFWCIQKWSPGYSFSQHVLIPISRLSFFLLAPKTQSASWSLLHSAHEGKSLENYIGIVTH